MQSSLRISHVTEPPPPPRWQEQEQRGARGRVVSGERRLKSERHSDRDDPVKKSIEGNSSLAAGLFPEEFLLSTVEATARYQP